MKKFELRDIIREEIEKIFHISPSGKKTNMSPNDDDYDINYGSKKTREKIAKKVFDVSEHDIPIPPAKRGYKDLSTSYGKTTSKQDLGVSKYEKDIQPQLKRRIEGIRAILGQMQPETKDWKTVKDILDRAENEMFMPTDKQMALVSALYAKNLKEYGAASGMELSFADNKPKNFSHLAPNDERKSDKKWRKK